MNYREFPPHVKLSRYIDCYWTVYLTLDSKPEGPDLVLPDGCVDLLFPINSDIHFKSLATGRRYHINTPSVIGQQLSSLSIDQKNPIGIFGIRFKPYGFQMLSTITQLEIQEQVTAATDFLGNWITRFQSAIVNAGTTAERIQLVNNKLYDKLLRHYGTTDGLTMQAVHQILLHRGNIRIDTVTKQLGLHRTSLERKFSKYIGLQPKEFARIIRFNHLVKDLARGTLVQQAAFAYHHGYADQSHMIREFKWYTGMTPGRFISTQIRLPEIAVVFAENRTAYSRAAFLQS